ncbi:Uncharacterized protein HBNXHr_1828 [Halorhabdus sp. BNX81]|nr:Uncharacterized protein HBNXHr_1828 [Halorhabdus sp. BNX81]
MLVWLIPTTMTPERISESIAASEDRFDRDRYYAALRYVHDDGRKRRP